MKRLLLALWPLLLLAACSAGDGTSAEGGGHGGGITVTHYSEATELFAEYRPLVTGKDRRFDAHVSWIADYRPVDEGRLTAELTYPDGTVDRATAEPSDIPGIFRPLLTASKAGEARLRLILDARGQRIVHDLGDVTIHATSEEGAAAVPAHEENPDAIAFPKEAQWRVPFATRSAAMRRLARTVPVTVDVQLAPQAEAVIAAPVDGIIRFGGRIPARGGSVRQGQILATISATLGGGEDIATLDYDISEARIAIDAAQREANRMNTLVRAEAAPRRRLDEAQTELRMARARLAAAQRRRAAVSGGGPGVPLVAPISGQILQSSLVQGAPVRAGEQLMRIGDAGALWLVAHVPEAQAGAVGTPTRLDLAIEGETVILRADNRFRLVQNSGVIDPQTRTLDVTYAYFGDRVRPGQRLQGRLAIGDYREALSVPANAVLTEDGQQIVYVQISGEAFERRMVETGLRSGNYVEITGDVRRGERVVTRGAAAVRAAAATPDAFGHGHAH